MARVNKYVNVGDKFIFFDESINHSVFKNLNPKSAGYFIVKKGDSIDCYGESKVLEVKSDIGDTHKATMQVFGKPRKRTLMTFGKYKGKPLNEVPVQYCIWAIKNVAIQPSSLRKGVDEKINSYFKKLKDAKKNKN